jgi:hypothetical protein
MPRRRDSDEDYGTGNSLAGLLRAGAHAALLAAATFSIGALFGHAAFGIGSVAVAATVGMGLMIASDAVRGTALAANAGRRCEREDERSRQDAAVPAYERAVANWASDQTEHTTQHADQVSWRRKQRAKIWSR